MSDRYEILQNTMARIAKHLNTNVSNLKAEKYDNSLMEYMTTERRDKIIWTDGLMNNLPFLQYARYHGNTNPLFGYGIHIFESRVYPEIKYAVVHYETEWNQHCYLVCKSGHLFWIHKAAQELSKVSIGHPSPPILEEVMLEDILKNSINFIQKSRQIKSYGVRTCRGLLLDGSPGNGKTLVCKYLQKLCKIEGIKWNIVTSSVIEQAYKDSNLNALFTSSEMLFFDDIDICYLNRSSGDGKVACSILGAMDGISEHYNCVVRVFTTNEPIKHLDSAFTRPGRIDKHITFPKPTPSLRAQLITEIWPKEIQDNIDINELVEHTHNFSFAELESVRTLLVINKLSDYGKWDLKKVFGELGQNIEQKGRIGLNGYKRTSIPD